MSRNTKISDKNMRRSALSFDGANGSLDVDHLLQSDPWKNVSMFDKSEAGCIQNMLNDFNDKIQQEKNVKAGHTTTKKSPNANPRSTKKSPIKDPSTDLPENSSNANSNVVETKTAVNKRKGASKSRQISKTVEEIISQELISQELISQEPCEEPQTFLKSTAEENDSMKQMIENETLRNITNTMKDLQTSTPKKGMPKITKGTKNGKSMAENKKPKIKDSENKSKKDVQHKERQKISKKNTQDNQGENSANMRGKEKKTNVKLENNNMKIKTENNLDYNVNQDTLKNKVKNKKEQCCETLLNQMEKTCKVAKINCNTEKNAKSKKCNKNMLSQLKRKQKKENSENKLQKCVQSNKSPQINKMKDTKCQCKRSCAKDSGNQCCSKERVKKLKQYQKNVKVAKAIDQLSRRITLAKKKMEIKVDLEISESSDSGSSYTDESSYTSQSSYSSDSCSYCSCTSTCSCSCWESDYTYDSSDSFSSSETSGNTKKCCS